jgi:hypothetical protein
MKSAKFLTIIAVLILALTVTSVIAAQGSDEEAFDFPLLLAGETESNALEDGIFAQLYAFWGKEGDEISLQMNRTADSEIDPYLILLDASGAILAVDDDGGDVIGNAFIDGFELPEDGVYLVFATFADYILFTANVLDQDDFGPMDYEIRLQGATSPENRRDSVLNLNGAELSLGDSARLEISQETPVAFITFFAETGDSMTISTSPNGDTIDTMLYLFNNVGQAIAFNDDGENTAAFYSAIEGLNIADEGMHLVIATSYQFYLALENDWENIGLFNLSVEQ